MIIKNPVGKKYEEVTKAVEQNGGYCPCLVFKNEDTKCMCKEFREQESGMCRCGRFIKINSKTTFNHITDDWKRVKNHCRTTVGKTFSEKEPTKEFKKKLLISEHSPIRLIEFDWSWKNIKYWVSTEWSRHKFEKFITSQRNDRQSSYDRNSARQDSCVNFDGYANMQNLIDAWRKRLCFQATKEARDLAVDFKFILAKEHKEEADVLVPHCIYRCGCPEINPCGFFKSFLKYCEENKYNITDIQQRYNAYNEMFNLNIKE